MAKAVAMRLEVIDEQDFCDCSDGFRPGRRPQQALQAVRQGRRKNGMRSVLTWDISACVDQVPHDTLCMMRRTRIKDGRGLEGIELWLNAGILDGKEMVVPAKGSPHGAVHSPLVANGYVHAVLDRWCETVVQAHGRGKVVLYRSADDVGIGCEREADARRIIAV